MLSASSSAHLYGKGIFTTVAVIDGAPFRWERHWKRLSADAFKIGLDLSAFAEEDVCRELHDAVSNASELIGRARLTFSDGSHSKIWSAETNGTTQLSILVGESRRLFDRSRLLISPYLTNSRSPLAGVKSCNYLENIMAIDDAKGRGYDEAIRLNERDEVTSGCMANVFWFKDQQMFTPSLMTGCLPGTTREYVLENIECREVEEVVEALRSADAIFLTSAGLGIVEVGEFEQKTQARQKHPILDLWPPRTAGR